MINYNYQEAMRNDIREYIREHYDAHEIQEKLQDRDEWQNELHDDLWITDSVTGNASGSYTFNSNTAREYVTDNTDLLQEALREFCDDAENIANKFLNGEWEYFDVTIRCYLLWGMISEILDEIEEEEAEEEENASEEETA